MLYINVINKLPTYLRMGLPLRSLNYFIWILWWLSNVFSILKNGF